MTVHLSRFFPTSLSISPSLTICIRLSLCLSSVSPLSLSFCPISLCLLQIALSSAICTTSLFSLSFLFISYPLPTPPLTPLLFFVCPYHYLSNSYSLYLPIVLPASLTLCSHISPTIRLSICLPCFLFLYFFFLLAFSLPVCQFICLLYFFYSPAYTSLCIISPSCLLLLPHRILLLFVHLILCLYHWLSSTSALSLSLSLSVCIAYITSSYQYLFLSHAPRPLLYLYLYLCLFLLQCNSSQCINMQFVFYTYCCHNNSRVHHTFYFDNLWNLPDLY